MYDSFTRNLPSTNSYLDRNFQIPHDTAQSRISPTPTTTAINTTSLPPAPVVWIVTFGFSVVCSEFGLVSSAIGLSVEFTIASLIVLFGSGWVGDDVGCEGT